MFVKVCGCQNEQDALVAVAMGADAIGFNFVSGSTRQIPPSRARDIARRLPGGIVTVGVFRNELPERVVEVMDVAGLRVAQLHGRESASDSSWIAQRVPSVIKAFIAGDPAAEQAKSYGAEVVLIDGPQPGSGRIFDWRRLEGVGYGLPLLLAGGLTPSNVTRAVETVRPWGVDVASGVEDADGRKDALAMRDFVANARKAVSPRPASVVSSDADGDGAGLADTAPYDWRTE